MRGLGQFARHPVGVGEGGGEGRTEGLDLGLDALPPVDLFRMGLVLRGHQREILVGAGLQARLHDGERFQQTAEFVAAPDRDIIREIAGRHALGNAHRGGDRLAERIGEGDCDE